MGATLSLSGPLREALTRFAQVQADVQSAGTLDDFARKQALVRSRRQLAEEIGRLGPAIEQDVELSRVPEKQRELSKLFSGMRYALALHQANWPVVKIDEDPVSYRQSVMAVRGKSNGFWQWCKDNLGVERASLIA